MTLDPRIGLCIALAVLWIGVILIVFNGWPLLVHPTAPRPLDRNSAVGESRRTSRADGGRFRAPCIPFDPSNRTSLKRAQLTALVKSGDRAS